MDNDKTRLAGLLALRAVCCGMLLLMLGGMNLGSAIAALAWNGWGQAGRFVLAALGPGWWLAYRRRATTCASENGGAPRPETGAASFRQGIFLPLRPLRNDAAREPQL